MTSGSPQTQCPRCLCWYDQSFFNCPSCELIIDGDALDRSAPPGPLPEIIRRMFAADGTVEAAGFGDDDVATRQDDFMDMPATVHRQYPDIATGVPRLMAGVNVTLLNITPYQAYVLSRIDGVSTVDMLRQQLGVSRIELNVLLHALCEKGLVDLRGCEMTKVDASGPVTETRARPPQKTSAPPRARPHESTTVRCEGPSPRRRRSQAATQQLGHPGTERFDRQPTTTKKKPANSAPKQAEGLLQKAIRYERAGDPEAAIATLEQAIKLSPHAPALYNRLAIVLLKERRDYKKAELLLRQAIELSPDNPVISKNLTTVVLLAARSEC